MEYREPLFTIPYNRDYFTQPKVGVFPKPTPRDIFKTEGIPKSVEKEWRKELKKARTNNV